MKNCPICGTRMYASEAVTSSQAVAWQCRECGHRDEALDQDMRRRT